MCRAGCVPAGLWLEADATPRSAQRAGVFEEETLHGDVAGSGRPTGIRQSSRYKQGGGLLRGDGRQSRLGSGRVQGDKCPLPPLPSASYLSSLLAGLTQSPEGKEKHCFFHLFWDKRKVGGSEVRWQRS